MPRATRNGAEECVSEISSVHHAKRCHERGGSLKRRGRGAASAFIAVAAAATHHRRRRRPPRSSSPPSPASHGRRSLSPMQLFRIASSRPLAATRSSSPPDLIRHHHPSPCRRHTPQWPPALCRRQLFMIITCCRLNSLPRSSSLLVTQSSIFVSSPYTHCHRQRHRLILAPSRVTAVIAAMQAVCIHVRSNDCVHEP